jgi:hypothetical protein
VSEGYQSTGHKDFWFFVAILVIISAGMAVSDVLGEYTDSVWLPILLGVILWFPSRWLGKKAGLFNYVPNEHYSGWRRYFNSPLFSFFMLVLLSVLNIFYPWFSNGHPDYTRALAGGFWLAWAFAELLFWYKKLGKVN